MTFFPYGFVVRQIDSDTSNVGSQCGLARRRHVLKAGYWVNGHLEMGYRDPESLGSRER